MQATPVAKLTDAVDLGTPSAPPIVDIGKEEHNSEIGSVCGETLGNSGLDQKNDEVNMSNESEEDSLRFEACKRYYSQHCCCSSIGKQFICDGLASDVLTNMTI